MPRPEPPPTPAASTEIKGQDGSQFSSLQMSFELPPPAVLPIDSSSASASASSSTSSYCPPSPPSPALPASEVVKIRRRSSLAQKPAAKDPAAFALPPPPTRSRKIIQMKPREPLDEPQGPAADAPKTAAGKTPAPKKKQPSSTSVAGRKIARKTAHSLIERRRRSKMNEEFGVLKDMIPACTGEMHKLAILQASIDYVRYLEDCVAKLKAENHRTASTPTSEGFVLPPPAVPQYHHQQRRAYDEDDVEMAGSPTYSQRPSESPALRARHDSYSSASADRRHYSFSASSTASPALGPTAYDLARSSALTSPALAPQRDLDQEATAALLMLNTDRRGTHGSAGRGMSVRDLLST